MANRIIFLIIILLQFSNTMQGQSLWPAGVTGDLQHTGALHIYAEKGDLEVSVYKKDLKNNGRIDRTVVIYLTGPDGSVHASEKILSPPGQWNGEEGPLQKVVLRAKVVHPGVYTLLIACNDDPYLRKNQLWGFATNAKKYMFNSGTGHLDTERMEPISLRGGNTPFSVFFKPELESFKVLLEHLPMTPTAIELRNPKDEVVWEAKVTDGKITSEAIPNKVPGVWELRLSVSKANILVEGLNYKFKRNTPILPVWATSRASYFDLAQVHWLLQPRRIARNLQPGAKGSIDFSVFNNDAKQAKYKLTTHLPANFPGKVNLKNNALTVSKGGSEKIALSYEMQNGVADGIYSFTLSCKNEVTGVQAFSLVELRVNKGMISKALDLPVQFKIFEHDQFQFAYEPTYPTENEFYFDKDNRPWVITTEGVKTLIKKHWQTVKIPGYEEKDIRFPSTTLATDADGNVYAIAHLARKPFLIKASAKNLNAELVELPVRGTYSIETNPGRKDSSHPPGVLSYTINNNAPRIGLWSASHEVKLMLLETKAGKLAVAHTIPVTKNGIGVSMHSGVPNTIVSDENTVHIVWGETSDPKLKYPGVPIHTASYDRKAGKLIDSTFIGYAPPVNDIHNTSSIIMDNNNKPEIIIASHGRPFFYRYATDDVKKWSAPQQVSTYDQTYVGAVFDKDNTIHLFYRVWERGKDFPGKFQTAMYYQTKTKKGEWSQPKLFALPALPAYSLYKHRVTVDKLGNLFLNMEYWSTWTAYRDMLSVSSSLTPKKNNRMSFISKDKGITWTVLTDQDLERNN
jgi:hypothetical protein